MPDRHQSESGFQSSIINLKPVEKVTGTFPDGAQREYPKGITGSDLAKGISPSLAKCTVAMALDRALQSQRSDLARRPDPN
jgi:threonyl-tRNA synthetase